MDYGTIKNPARARQLNIFDGLSSKGIGATDIDGMIEYHNLAYVIYEVKGVGVEVPFGQQLALERMVNDFSSIGKKAIAMVVEHNDIDPDVPVSVKDCRVRQIYLGDERRWRPTKKRMTAGQLTDAFINMVIKPKGF